MLHEASITPVREKRIPLKILNTNDPSDEGTVIMEKFEENIGDRNLLTGIAGRRDFTLVTIKISGMSGRPGVFCELLEPFAEGALFDALGKNGINVRLITQEPEEVCIIVGVNNEDFDRCVRVIYDSLVRKIVK